MSAVDMRADLQSWMEKVDESFLSAMHAMVGTYLKKQEGEPIVGYTVEGEAVTVSQFLADAEEAVAAAKAGEGITVEELRKRSEGWLARSK